MSKSATISRSRITGHSLLRMAVFLFLALCLLAAAVTFFTLSMVKPYMGVNLSMKGQDWKIGNVDANGAAYQAGIRQGDSPVEINGQPAESVLGKYEKAGTVLGTLIIKLVVTDEYGRVKSVALEGNSPSVQSVIEVISSFFLSLVFWVAGFFVFFKRPRSVPAWLLCSCGLVFGLALSATISGTKAIPSALEASVAAVVFAPWLLFHFFLVLPEERPKLRKTPSIYLIYIAPTITLALFFLVGYANGQPVQWFRNIRLLEAGVVLMATVGVAIFNFYSAVSPRTRQQMRIILISCLAALIPFLFLYLLPETIWGQPIVPGSISILFISFIPLGMGYAVVTQKLMDIDVIIRRGVIYGLVSIMMTVILSVAIFPILFLRRSIGVPEAILIALVLGGIATVLFGPAKRGAGNLVDRLFYKDRYDYRQIIQSVSTALNLVRDIYEASRLIVGSTVRTLNLNSSALFIRTASGSFELGAAQGTYTDPSKQKELLAIISQSDQVPEFPNSASTVISDLAFLIPLMAGDKKVGVLCISQKVSRQDFSSDDLFLLQGTASITAMALHSAMLIRDVSLRDTFVSIASHELRTPLTTILGYADLLLRRDPPEDIRKRWLQNILDSSHRISAMVDDLLNVSRIQSGKTGIKLDKVKLAEILEGTLDFVMESSKKHEFVVEIQDDIPDVLVDRDKFGQVVGNLLSNAIKYSPSGGRVILSAYNDKERHLVVVSVADEGMGIGQEDMASLFTTFHRIQRPETQGIKGSGLGLYIAKEWTEAMGGRLWLESEMNKGSTFYIGISTWDKGVS